METQLVEKNNQNELIVMAIIRTIAFFDLFDYPLTPFEIWRYLPACPKRFASPHRYAKHCWRAYRCGRAMPASAWQASGQWLIEVKLEQVWEILSNGETGNKIEEKEGFYFLAGRSELVQTRKARYNYADRKMRRALAVARLFKTIPWIKMVAVSNLIGAHNLRDASDIDFFIISQAKRVWLTRFGCVGIVKLLNLRPSQGRTRDTVCLNFYLTTEALNLEKLTLPDDIYFIYWLAGLAPIYNREETYEKFIAANPWLKTKLPNWRPAKPVYWRDLGQRRSRLYYRLSDLILGWAERPLKKLQLKIMPEETRSKINQSTEVVASDEVIKLHVKDRREEFKKKFENQISKINQENK